MMTCSEYQILISGMLDGELTDEQMADLKTHLNACPDCRKVVERGRIVTAALELASIRTPEDDFWDGYWAGIYNRLERNVGWIVFTVGALVLFCGSIFLLIKALLFDENTPLWVSIGGILTGIGTIVLVVSLIRERFRLDRHERYKDVRR
jgi:predicted anti-sigma-YlaC factor YlaD